MNINSAIRNDDGWLAKTVREIGLQERFYITDWRMGVGINYYGLVIEVDDLLLEAMY